MRQGPIWVLRLEQRLRWLERRLAAFDRRLRVRPRSLSRQLTVLKVLAGLCAAVLAVAVATLITRPAAPSRPSANRAPRPATQPAAPVPTPSPPAIGGREALAWARANLARQTPVAAAASLAEPLRRAGFTRVVTLGGRQHPPLAPSTLLFADPVLDRDSAATVGLGARAPVAVFGAPGAYITAEVVVGGSATQLAKRSRADLTWRRSADTALASNPDVTTAPGVAAQLRDGQLDLRPATFLALLAGQSAVRVLAIPVEPAEAAAAQPARTITIAARSRAAIAATLGALPPRFAPAARTTAPDGSVTLRWPIAVDPIQPVS